MYFLKKDNDMRSIFDGFYSLFSTDTRLLRTDIEELSNEYVISIEVPGISKENISIDITDETLTVTTNSKSESDKSYVRRERYSVSGSRSYYLKDADESNVKAKLENGLLTIIVSKKTVENNKKNNISIE